MSQSTPLLAALCPQCNQPMIRTVPGDVCVSCNILVRHPNPPESPTHQALPSLSIDPVPVLRENGTTAPHLATKPPNAGTQKDSPPLAPMHPSKDGVKSAIRYRHRLQARLRRLIVPELPTRPYMGALESPLESTAIEQPTTAPKIKDSHPLPPSEKLQSSVSQPLGQDSQAWALAEAIAESDTLAQANPGQPTNKPTAQNKANPIVLLGATVATMAMVGVLGLWAARTNRTAPKPTQQAIPTNNETTSPKVAVEARKRDAQRKTDLNALSAALEVYKRQEGVYPTGNDISVIYPLQYTTPPFISYVNYDPLSDDDTKIKYSYTSDGSSFTIAARLEDSTDTDNQNGYYIVRSK